MIWPNTAASPSVVPYAPMARARDAPVYVVVMMARTCGVRSPADTPCRTLPATSNPAFGASPHAAEAIVKAPRAIANRRRRP